MDTSLAVLEQLLDKLKEIEMALREAQSLIERINNDGQATLELEAALKLIEIKIETFKGLFQILMSFTESLSKT